jgi:hypothetical protein
MRCDNNILFEPSLYQSKNYQEYHYKFEDEDDEDPIDKLRNRASNSFRIKETPRKFATC